MQIVNLILFFMNIGDISYGHINISMPDDVWLMRDVQCQVIITMGFDLSGYHIPHLRLYGTSHGGNPLPCQGITYRILDCMVLHVRVIIHRPAFLKDL